MIVSHDGHFRNVTGISDIQRDQLHSFLQGAVYCWCKNRKDEWFSIRDLMGGDNFNWNGTPLFPLWQKRADDGWDENDAIVEAGKEAGWLLKSVLNNDLRRFETKKEELVRKYRWII